MKILIIGNGGREHALAWRVAQSTKVQQVFVAPGNAGTAREAKLRNVPIQADNIKALVNFAKQNTIDLTIVGPEIPLVLGITDEFQKVGLHCFGPNLAAAQLEASKTFTKDFLIRHDIPTAAYATFTEINKAIAYINEVRAPIVVKADGLAAGKGVIVAQTRAEAIAAVKDMLSGKAFGEAGQRIVIEEFLTGEEASFTCLVDGKHILPLATSQDHKARDNGDKGPNTGGMGAYSPAPVVTSQIYTKIIATIIKPTVRGMAAEGRPYTGFLYAGLMIDAQGNPKVLEYNCRLGDPETQPILLRLRSDLMELCMAALEERLHLMEIKWDSRPALGVVLAAGGYPTKYEKGLVISGLSNAKLTDGKIFHAGTAEKDGQIITAGGRVLCVCTLGDDMRESRNQTYKLVKKIHWEGMYYRTDIGHRALSRINGN